MKITFRFYLLGFCLNKADGFYPDPTDCQKYFQCQSNNLIILSCNPGFWFDPEGTFCNLDFLVNCNTGKISSYILVPIVHADSPSDLLKRVSVYIKVWPTTLPIKPV